MRRSGMATGENLERSSMAVRRKLQFGGSGKFLPKQKEEGKWSIFTRENKKSFWVYDPNLKIKARLLYNYLVKILS